jgi:hypothetical protein
VGAQGASVENKELVWVNEEPVKEHKEPCVRMQEAIAGHKAPVWGDK